MFQKKLLIIFLALICILIVIGVYIYSNESLIEDMNDEITINDSMPDMTNSEDNGTIWLEENGTLKEVNVTETSASGSASS